MLSPAEARRLLEAIDTGTLVCRRDRAFVSVMLYSRISANLLRPVDDGLRAGWAVRFEGQWVAIVTGESSPRGGEVFWLWLYSKREWVTVAVTKVIDGRPGHWRVHQRFLGPGDEGAAALISGQDGGMETMRNDKEREAGAGRISAAAPSALPGLMPSSRHSSATDVSRRASAA